MKGKSAVAGTNTRYKIRDFKVVKVLKDLNETHLIDKQLSAYYR